MSDNTEDRHNLIGLDIVRRETGEVELFTAFSRDEIDMPGYVESVQSGYVGTQWHAMPVYRTRLHPATTRQMIDLVREYVGLVERIHQAYAGLVLDTPEEQAIHAQLVAVADQSLTLVKQRLHGRD